MPSPYKRGRSGYSEADEAAAERNALLDRRISSLILGIPLTIEDAFVL